MLILPFLLFAGLGLGLTVAGKKKLGQPIVDTQVAGNESMPPIGLPTWLTRPPDDMGAGTTRLIPEQERLLTLLTLFVKDRKFPPGRKRFMNRALASETIRCAKKFDLPKTAKAVLMGKPLPTGERFPHTKRSVSQAVGLYALGKPL
jgi:hypothetical protein